MPPNKRSVRFLRNAAKSGNGVKKMGRSRPRRGAGGEDLLEVADPLGGGNAKGRITSLKTFTDSRAVLSTADGDEDSMSGESDGSDDDAKLTTSAIDKNSKNKKGSAERCA
jgi:hypothetical protein